MTSKTFPEYRQWGPSPHPADGCSADSHDCVRHPPIDSGRKICWSTRNLDCMVCLPRHCAVVPAAVPGCSLPPRRQESKSPRKADQLYYALRGCFLHRRSVKMGRICLRIVFTLAWVASIAAFVTAAVIAFLINDVAAYNIGYGNGVYHVSAGRAFG